MTTRTQKRKTYVFTYLSRLDLSSRQRVTRRFRTDEVNAFVRGLRLGGALDIRYSLEPKEKQ